MKKYNAYEIKKVQYNNFFAIFAIQCTMCLIIIIGVWGMKHFKPDMLEVIGLMTRKNIEWETLSNFIAEIKDIVLHYIR